MWNLDFVDYFGGSVCGRADVLDRRATVSVVHSDDNEAVRSHRSANVRVQIAVASKTVGEDHDGPSLVGGGWGEERSITLSGYGDVVEDGRKVGEEVRGFRASTE